MKAFLVIDSSSKIDYSEESWLRAKRNAWTADINTNDVARRDVEGRTGST
jgi:hypothetical protein